MKQKKNKKKNFSKKHNTLDFKDFGKCECCGKLFNVQKSEMKILSKDFFVSIICPMCGEIATTGKIAVKEIESEKFLTEEEIMENVLAHMSEEDKEWFNSLPDTYTEE